MEGRKEEPLDERGKGEGETCLGKCERESRNCLGGKKIDDNRWILIRDYLSHWIKMYLTYILRHFQKASCLII